MAAVESRAAAAGSRPGARAAGPWLACSVIAVVGLVLPLLIARHYGALGAARGDDWSYLVTLFRWVDTGRLEFNDWVSMSLLGQLVLAAPIAIARGHAITLVQTQTAVIGLGGLVALAALGRRLSIGWGATTLAVLTIALSPLWLILCTTFMTDVPAFAVSTGGLLLATIALQRRPIRTPLLITGLALATYAVLIRQYAIVPVVAIALATGLALAHEADRRRIAALAITVVVLAGALGAFFVWWYSVPDAKAVAPSLPAIHELRTTVIKGAGFLRLGGLLLLPVICWRGPVRIVRASWRAARGLTVVVTVGVALWQAVTATRYLSAQFVGNYLIRDGALSIAVLPGRRPDVMPGFAWNGLVVAGSIGAVVLALAAIPTIVSVTRRAARREFATFDPVISMLGLTILGFGAAYALAMLTGVQVYDRYALPALAIAALLLVRGAPEDRSALRFAAAGVALVLLGTAGVNAAVDSASFDGARWRLAERVVAGGGWRAKQVNGGFEWVNFHRGRRYTVAARTSVTRILPDGTVQRFAPFCVNLRVAGPDQPPDRSRVIATTEYVALLRGPVPIVAARSSRPCESTATSGSVPAPGGLTPPP